MKSGSNVTRCWKLSALAMYTAPRIESWAYGSNLYLVWQKLLLRCSIPCVSHKEGMLRVSCLEPRWRYETPTYALLLLPYQDRVHKSVPLETHHVGPAVSTRNKRSNLFSSSFVLSLMQCRTSHVTATQQGSRTSGDTFTQFRCYEVVFAQQRSHSMFECLQ